MRSGIKDDIELFFNINKTSKSLKSKSKFYYDELLIEDKVDKVYIGTQEFKRYPSFVYLDSKYVVMESLNPDNVTYIFSINNSEDLSKLRKQELIKAKKYYDRIFYFEKSWKQTIKKYLP